MRLELGSAVHCADGTYGELADVVIDPIRRRLTHLVVQPHHRHDLARLVPVDRAQPLAPSDAGISLDYTIGELDQLEPLQQSAYLRLGEAPVEDPDWEIGIENVLALPYYGSFTPGAVGMGMPTVGFDGHVTEIYDRVPKDRIEVRRASAVISADDHRLGHVDGFVVDDQDGITHLVLEYGHLWGKREITIPIGTVAGIENDEIRLSLSKQAVGELESVPVHRWAT
jgi:sporulation protein YlmC with PRC-barrel domain